MRCMLNNIGLSGFSHISHLDKNIPPFPILGIGTPQGYAWCGFFFAMALITFGIFQIGLHSKLQKFNIMTNNMNMVYLLSRQNFISLFEIHGNMKPKTCLFFQRLQQIECEQFLFACKSVRNAERKKGEKKKLFEQAEGSVKFCSSAFL